MAAQIGSKQQSRILDQIIDNAIGLPVESLDALLMVAKAIRHTKNCMAGKEAVKPCDKQSGYT